MYDFLRCGFILEKKRATVFFFAFAHLLYYKATLMKNVPICVLIDCFEFDVQCLIQILLAINSGEKGNAIYVLINCLTFKRFQVKVA